MPELDDAALALLLEAQGVGLAPDLCWELIGPKLAAADALGLGTWLGRDDAFTADDPFSLINCIVISC
jgi:hypothetical protein